MIKLIASDIDGTLITDYKKGLNPEIYDLILELKAHDIHFVVASGRQLESQQYLFSPVKNDISYISENGAICMHDGKRYVVSEFDRDLAMRILQQLDRFPHCKGTVSTPATQYIKSGDKEFYEYMSTKLKYHITPIDSFEDITEPIVKIGFFDPVTYSESLDYFSSMFGEEIRVAQAGVYWFDFICFDSNKGTALKFLSEKMHVDPSEIISFGDQQNDIEMLEFTGKSYAMSHAKPEIQRHATDLSNSVAETLREILKTLG